MPRYIDAELAEQLIQNFIDVLERDKDTTVDLQNRMNILLKMDGAKSSLRILQVIHTADVQEVKHGRWIAISNGNMKHWKERCSECGIYTRGQSPFCKNCGAKMDGGKQE